MIQKRTSLKDHGFSLIELIVVIVVIGILAAITIVSYNGIQTRATNTSRATEVRKYADLITLYQATLRKFPAAPDVADIPNGTYCLGTGFPQSPSNPSVRTCRNWTQTPGTSVTPTEASSARLMEELAKVGTVSSENHNNTSDPVIGPYIQIHSDRVVVTTILSGKNQAVCDEFKVKLDTTNPDDMGWDGFAATGKPLQSCGVIIAR